MTANHVQQQRSELIAELEAAGAQIRGNKILCPFHDDHNPSGGVWQGKDLVWRYKCQSCGTHGDVFDLKALRTGKPLAEILRENAHDAPRSTNGGRPIPREGAKSAAVYESLEAVYAYLQKTCRGGRLECLHEYTQRDGTHVQYVIRWRIGPGEKTIRPCVKTPAGYELRKAEQPVLYRLPFLEKAENVLVVEGEKKADVLASFGFQAITTSSGGSKAAALTDWTPLAGKNVIVWPDADEPGRAYAAEVIKILDGLPLTCRVKMIDPSSLDLADGEDAADYVQQLKNAGLDDFAIKKSLSDVFLGAAPVGGCGDEMTNQLREIGAGKHAPTGTGFETLDDLVQILPGTLNLVCGNPGSAKSLWMLQLARLWHDEGIRLAIFELEKNRSYHLRRALAQQAGQSQITKNKWVQENAEEAVRISQEHSQYMNRFGKCIDARPEKMVYQKDIIEWAEHKVKTGCRVLIIDPATKAERTDEPFKADARFVTELQRIATLSGAVIFLVLHPGKIIVPIPDLCYISGGAAYSRFADNALWLQLHDEDGQTSLVKTCCGTVQTVHDISLWILKSRDGAGTGSRIAFQFDRGDLTLREVGKICREKKQKKSFEN